MHIMEKITHQLTRLTITALTILTATANFASASTTTNNDGEQPKLSRTFTAERDYLMRIRAIKEATKSPDHFSIPLADLATEIVQKVTAKIPADDPRYEDLKMVKWNAKNEIKNETLSLNRLNYLVFQLSCALNPNVDSPYEIFEGFNLLMKNKSWKLDYNTYLSIARQYVGNIKKLPNENNSNSLVDPENLIISIFRPCDRGMWVFPLVTDNPIYGFKTYAEAFVDGISITGLPLLAKNCNVHSGLINEGDFVYFILHDLLHNQTLAPSINIEENKTHVGAMQKVTARLLNKIETLPVAEQKTNYGNLFWLIHELVDYTENWVTLFNGTEDTDRVFELMVSHAKTYVNKVVTPTLDSKGAYYKFIFNKAMSDDKHTTYKKIAKFQIFNEKGESDTYKEPSSKYTENIKNKFVMRAEYSDKSAHTISKNIFFSYDVQQAFTYSQAIIMKYCGKDICGGADLENYKPSAANKAMIEMLDTFYTDMGGTLQPAVLPTETAVKLAESGIITLILSHPLETILGWIKTPITK